MVKTLGEWEKVWINEDGGIESHTAFYNAMLFSICCDSCIANA